MWSGGDPPYRPKPEMPLPDQYIHRLVRNSEVKRRDHPMAGWDYDPTPMMSIKGVMWGLILLLPVVGLPAVAIYVLWVAVTGGLR